MAVVRVPFCATVELASPFILDETFANPNGVKSVMLDKSNIQVVGRMETVEMPDIGPVQICVFYVIGTIQYICNAFPVVPSDVTYDVSQQSAQFDNTSGNTAPDPADTVSSDALCWLSASGCVHVAQAVGGSCCFDDIPEIESVTVEELAVANNSVSALTPDGGTCGDEEKRIVKWSGSFVITTSG
jgi:hypothetical protein